MKKCVICKQEKSLDDFHNCGKGKASYCKPCQNAFAKMWREKNKEHCRKYKKEQYKKSTYEYRRLKHIKARYGITIEEYEEMYQKQNGVCAICFNKCDKKAVLSVDHCHDTSVVRGLLCDNCNNMLGRAKDNIFNLMSGIKYLAK